MTESAVVPPVGEEVSCNQPDPLLWFRQVFSDLKFKFQNRSQQYAASCLKYVLQRRFCIRSFWVRQNLSKSSRCQPGCRLPRHKLATGSRGAPIGLTWKEEKCCYLRPEVWCTCWGHRANRVFIIIEGRGVLGFQLLCQKESDM